MPSSLNLNGLKVYRPNVYATVDASALGGQGVSSGNVVIVGEFTSFQQNELYTFLSAQALRDFDASDASLRQIGRIAFSPSSDERVQGGAESISILNVRPNTQAQRVFNDADGNGALLIKSRAWGPVGNRVLVALENENTDQVKITISKDGLSEVFEGIESGDLASIYYGGSNLDSISLSADRTNGAVFSWQQEEAISNGALSMTVSDMFVSSALTVGLSGTGHTDAVTVTIVGLDSEGASQTEILTFSAGVDTDQTTPAFSQITSISATTSDTAFGGSVEVAGSLTVAPADYNSLEEMIEFINSLSGMVASYTGVKSYPANEFDKIPSASILGSGNSATVRADLYAVLNALSVSTLVTVERASAGVSPLAEQTSGSSSALLAGGASSSVSLSDWTTALQGIEGSNLQIVVPWTTDINQLKEVKKHLVNSARAGRERNAWVSAPYGQSLTNVLNNWVKELNDRNIALVAQKIKVQDPEGNIKTLVPFYLALMLASMQAGTPIGTPLTRKRPDVLDVVSTWDANTQAKEAILSGVVNLSYGSEGWRVERSVTTYVKDDNPIYSEVSANESVNASVRDLRVGLDPFVGNANTGLTANRLKSIVEARLNRQVEDGVIKAFKDVVLEDLGDTLRVNYVLSAVEPVNFIQVTAVVQRF